MKNLLIGFGAGVAVTSLGFVAHKAVLKKKTKAPKLKFDNLLFDTEENASKVLENMKKAIKAYDFVSIADFKDLAGVTSSFSDYSYGWTNLDNVNIVKHRNEFMIKLTDPKPFDE